MNNTFGLRTCRWKPVSNTMCTMVILPNYRFKSTALKRYLHLLTTADGVVLTLTKNQTNARWSSVLVSGLCSSFHLGYVRFNSTGISKGVPNNRKDTYSSVPRPDIMTPGGDDVGDTGLVKRFAICAACGHIGGLPHDECRHNLSNRFCQNSTVWRKPQCTAWKIVAKAWY